MSQAPTRSRLQELRNWRPNRDQGVAIRYFDVAIDSSFGDGVTQLQDPFETRTLAGNSVGSWGTCLAISKL
jgi:hypothetical protein